MRARRDVLVVDGDRPFAEAIAAVLSARGHRVTVAPTAESALGLPVPEVLVADVALEGLDGLELLARLRGRSASLLAVLMSGLPSVEACRGALKLGAREFLSKPFPLEELVRVVESESDARAPGGVAAASFERVYPADVRAADRAARDVSAWCLRSEVCPSTRARIASAVAELVDNAARHAYPDERPDGERPVEVRARMDARELTVEIRDQGIGFDPVPPTLALRGPGSHGIARASALAEDLVVRSQPGEGTRARARFGVSSVDFDVQGRIDMTELDHFVPDTARELLITLEEDPDAPIVLSPALAVVVGRLLAGASPRRTAHQALWS